MCVKKSVNITSSRESGFVSTRSHSNSFVIPKQTSNPEFLVFIEFQFRAIVNNDQLDIAQTVTTNRLDSTCEFPRLVVHSDDDGTIHKST